MLAGKSHAMKRIFSLAPSILLTAAGLVVIGAPGALAQTTFVGPVPYLSSANIPPGFYAGGAPTALENFEDCTLSFGVTASSGGAIGPGGLCGSGFGAVDSVDADDGTIDGSGTFGSSWFVADGPTGVTFTFPTRVTAAGCVWTDGGGTTTFEAFGPGMTSLGTIGPVAIADNSSSGTTAEDRFFGVKDSRGIVAIKLSNTAGGMEVDHLQFGAAGTPVPALPPLGSVALAALLLLTAAWTLSRCEREEPQSWRTGRRGSRDPREAALERARDRWR